MRKSSFVYWTKPPSDGSPIGEVSAMEIHSILQALNGLTMVCQNLSGEYRARILRIVTTIASVYPSNSSS